MIITSAHGKIVRGTGIGQPFTLARDISIGKHTVAVGNFAEFSAATIIRTREAIVAAATSVGPLLVPLLLGDEVGVGGVGFGYGVLGDVFETDARGGFLESTD